MITHLLAYFRVKARYFVFRIVEIVEDTLYMVMHTFLGYNCASVALVLLIVSIF